MGVLKKIAMILAAMILAALPALAEAGGFILPSDLKIVEAEAFAGLGSADEIVVPEGTEVIGARAFAGGSFSRIVLPDTLKEIAANAFEGCGNMTAEVLSGSYAEEYCIANSVRYEVKATPAEYFTYSTGTTVTITGYTGADAEVYIPAQIGGVNVTAIGSNAFKKNTVIEKVRIPRTVTAIGSGAFMNCTGLVNVTFTEGLQTIGQDAFYGCVKLQNVNLPTTLVSTGHASFGNCDSFTEITFQEGFTTLERYAFDGCDNLVKVNLPDSVISIGERAFKNCVSLAEFDYPISWAGVPRISYSYNVLEGCKSLTEITIPEGVTATPKGMFAGANYLEKVNLPSTLVNLGSNAFEGCGALRDIVLNEGLQTIGEYAFSGCVSLPNLAMPSTLISTAHASFANCDSFTRITFHDGFTTLGRYTFDGCDNLARVDLPDSVTNIGERAFNKCVSLAEFDYPLGWAGISRISSSYKIFAGCSSLPEIVVPEGVEYMPTGIFEGANCLQKVTLPSTLRIIPEQAFEGCTALTQCHISYGVENIDWRAFHGCSALLDLYVPTSVIDFGDWRDWRDSFGACNADFTLESEYGAIPIDYAKTFGLKYYYLSYTGRNVPKGTIYKGDTFNITGFVRSTLPLTDVTATVFDSDGNIVRQVQAAPGTANYSLASYISDEIAVGTLPLGKYTFTLRAQTEKSAETFVRTGFTVAPPPLRVYLRDYEPFSGFMSADSDASVAGVVTANYDMTSLAVQFIPGEGGETIEFAAAPGAKSYDLAKLNITASGLEPDTYEMQIVVQGNGETKTVGQRSFSLTTDAVPDGFTVDYDQLTAFIGNADNRELFGEYQVDYTMRIEETMTEEERFNLVMSQREDYSNATIRDTIDEILAGVDDKDTYLIELYKKEIADFIVDMGVEATTYQYDSAMHQAIADSLAQQKKIDLDFIGSQYGEISEYDGLILEGMGKVIDKISDTTGFVDTINDLSEIVGNFYKDYSRGIEIMEYLEVQYVGNEQYQYALDELKSEYFSNSYRAFNDVFTYAYKKAVESMTDAVVKVAANALSAGLYQVYEIAGFAEKVLDEVYDIYGDSNDYVTYAVQCETYQNARAAYRDAFDLVQEDSSAVSNVAKLKRSFEITRLSAIRALETLMNMKSYSCIDYTYPMMDLRELRKLTIGF